MNFNELREKFDNISYDSFSYKENESSISNLSYIPSVDNKTLEKYFPDGGLTFVFGVFKDKDFWEIAKITAPLADMIYTIKPPTDRGLSADELAKVVGKYNKNVVALNSISEAAKLCADSECNAVVCFGSLSFLAQIKKEMGIS